MGPSEGPVVRYTGDILEMQGRCRGDIGEIGLTSEGPVVRAVAAKPPG